MKKAYLIYYQKEAEKNAMFIRMFQERGKEYDISFAWVPAEEYKTVVEPDLVLNRTRDSSISAYFAAKGVPVFHSEKLVILGNHKYKAWEYLRQNLSAPFVGQLPDTLYLSRDRMKRLAGGEEELPWQGVIKSVDGHGGSQVFLTKQEEWKRVLDGQECILQERLDSNSEDLRVYVLGGKIYRAVLRRGGKDFRSNYSLGGSAEPYELSVAEQSMVQEYIRCLGGEKIGMAGIDFIRTVDGSLVFNELEEMVGSRMLYQCTDCDIVHDYVKWLATRI